MKISKAYNKKESNRTGRTNKSEIPEEHIDVQEALNAIPSHSISEKQTRVIETDKKIMHNFHCLTSLNAPSESEPYKVLRTQILQKTKANNSNTI
jgi:hypothetical protein